DAFKAFTGGSTQISSEARNSMREALGGKGAGLAEMTASGVNVPPGLTVVTQCCRDYHANKQQMPEGLLDQIFEELKSVET
ncbi:PEP/pyruvate-binding domain-containing protein, partial [Acinetobacter baumannii]